MHRDAIVARDLAHSFVGIASACTLAFSVFCLHHRTYAQETNPSANRQVLPQVSNDSNTNSVSPSKQIVYSNEDRQTANRTITLANRTLKHSSESFRRGLMDYADFELHLKTALKMKMTAAEVLQDRKLKNRFIQNYRATIDESVKLLKRFHQPGAQGWAGDLKQAELLATEARQLAAVFEENQNSVNNMNRARNRQALAILRIRTRDYRQGLASISQLSDAVVGTSKPDLNARLLKSHRIKKEQPPGRNSKPNRYQKRLQKELERIARRSSSLAGIGRSDRLFDQQTKLRQSRTLHSENIPRNRKSQILDRQNVIRQRRFYQTRTASLFDLTRSWLHRQQEIEESRRNRRRVDPNRTRFHQSDFEALVKRAKGIGDLRGRNAADVSLIKSLENYSRLSESVFRKQEESLEQQEKQNADSDLTGFLRIQFR